MKHTAHPVTNLLKDRTSVILFFTLSAMWGFTWLMGKYQIHNGILPEIAVFYRLVGVSVIMLFVMKFKKYSFKINKSDLKILFIFSIFCTSINLVFFYYAASFMITSISALIYSFLIILTALIKYIFKLAPEKLMPIFISGAIGIAGLFLIMLQKFYMVNVGLRLSVGIAMAFGGTLFYAIGSVFYENKRSDIEIKPLPSFFYTSIFGASISLLAAIIHSAIRGEAVNFIPNLSPSFIFSYTYLVISGFGVLLTMLLIQRVGAIKTSYVNFIIPVIAVFVSSIFENYTILPSTFFGIALILFSNYIAFFRKKIN